MNQPGIEVEDTILDVTLREFLEHRIQELEKRLMLQNELKSEAHELQAVEVERRLGELNHAHTRAIENFNTFLPRSEYSITSSEIQKWKESVEAWRNRMIGIALGSATGGGVIGALLAKFITGFS